MRREQIFAKTALSRSGRFRPDGLAWMTRAQRLATVLGATIGLLGG
ncbi:MAG TPA: hypothetical protein VKA74_13980 [Myxococcota bacterium]|nr:hypothetical protein [Myxococcota bacterium]